MDSAAEVAVPTPRRVAIVGAGRAGRSFAAALERCEWSVDLVASRPLLDGASQEALTGATLVLLTVPDDAIAAVADVIGAVDGVVAHVSGATDLDVLARHRRVGSIHPLMSLPDAATGAARLLDHCTFAVDGDSLMADVATSLGGRPIRVPGSLRALYHATASVASNHLVALCAQVERLARQVGVPADAFWTLMSTTLDNVAVVGPHRALTGPAARGDWGTVEAHLASLADETDRRLYLVMCTEAARLAGRTIPPDLGTARNTDGRVPS